MKKLLLGLLAIMTLFMAGCGGGSVEVVIPIEGIIEPPSIISHQFSKDAYTEYINGSVHFYAPDSDIDSMTTVVYDSKGYEISRVKTFLDLAGITDGVIPFSIDYVTFPSDTYAYTFSIYLTDFNRNTSNQAVDTFWVP